MFEFPAYVSSVIQKIQSHGYKAHLVGGCVRDAFLYRFGIMPAGKAAKDFDITTGATVEQVHAIFGKNCIDTGLKYGTVTVIEAGGKVEVTTYRIDGDYEGSRKPKSVTFTQDIRDDLARRDFTINAIAYNAEDGLIDLFGGETDIKNKTLRTVGDPNARFGEDALRIFRGIRFSAELDFGIEKDTLEGMKTNAHKTADLSGERIQAELNRILMSDNPGKVGLFETVGINKNIFPELHECYATEQNNIYHIENVGKHIERTVAALAKIDAGKPNVFGGSPALRLAAFLHDIGKPQAQTIDENGIAHFHNHAQYSEEISRAIMNKLKYSNAIKNEVLMLVKNHDKILTPNRVKIKKLVREMGADTFAKLILLERADNLSKNPNVSNDRMEKLNEAEAVFDDIIKCCEPILLSDLAVDGNDLIEIGITDGLQIKNTLNYLLTHVTNEPKDNKRERLLKLARA